MADRQLRVDLITGKIINHFTSRNVDVLSINAADWYQFVDRPQGRFGWSYPEPHNGRLRIICCPQVIAAQTVALDEKTLMTYLDALCWVADRYIHLAHVEGIDATSAQRAAEDDLYDQAAKSFRTLSEVQFMVIDSDNR